MDSRLGEDPAQQDAPARPALELASAVRSGELSASAVVEAALERIQERDSAIGAFTSVHAEAALAEAEGIEPGDPRPFAGVPIAIKDLSAAIAGRPLTQGSDLFGDYTPDRDAFVVSRLKRAGFVIVGQTSTPEMGILPVTEPRRFGPTRNPWDTARTPGGSSGGSAAAVAAGMVPLAHGSDGGGSIRIPAACCGLFGLKPSRGRISRGPVFGDSILATDGVLTRTVADTAAVLDLLSGYEPGDATWAPPPDESLAERASREPPPLRVGVVEMPPLEAEVDPVSLGAVRDAGELLQSLGHEVEDATPPWGGGVIYPEFKKLWAAQISVGVAFGAQIAGREPRAEDVEPLTWDQYERARDLPAVDYVVAVTVLQAYARAIVEFGLGYDVLMTPALAQRPVAIGGIDGCGEDPAGEFDKSARFTPYTAIANITGLPAMSVPLYQGEDGLPLAVHAIGRPLAEGTLLSLAAQLERVRPWADRRPPAPYD